MKFLTFFAATVATVVALPATPETENKFGPFSIQIVYSNPELLNQWLVPTPNGHLTVAKMPYQRFFLNNNDEFIYGNKVATFGTTSFEKIQFVDQGTSTPNVPFHIKDESLMAKGQHKWYACLENGKDVIKVLFKSGAPAQADCSPIYIGLFDGF